MEQNKKDVIVNVLKKLHFVNWDRYFGENVLTFFGWIDRKDNYKDFVTLDFDFTFWEECSISYTTSSKDYTKAIAKILNSTHSDCKRVEDFCDIENTIKL